MLLSVLLFASSLSYGNTQLFVSFRIMYSECVEPSEAPARCVESIRSESARSESSSGDAPQVATRVVFEHPLIIKRGTVYDLNSLTDTRPIKLKIIWAPVDTRPSRFEVQYEGAVAGKRRKGRIETSVAEFLNEGLLFDTFTNVRSENGNRKVSRVVVQLVAERSRQGGTSNSQPAIEENI